VSEAARSARSEAAGWLEVVSILQEESPHAASEDVPPTEAAVVDSFDPLDDLRRRAGTWGFRITDGNLGELATFGAALAVTEAESWEADQPHVATRAYAERRFLLGDRILHWAVPWLDSASRWYSRALPKSERARRTLLELGERLRPAPALVGAEGLTPPGEDAYGPIEGGPDVGERLTSVHGGVLLFQVVMQSLTGRPVEHRSEIAQHLADASVRQAIATHYQAAEKRWLRVADAYLGSARLWQDLAVRAGRTAELLRSG
jgi:hypothetical protein